ncbi:MAG: hypothetical protein LBJ00_05515 [Planctomycetaceae bacterium]|jgi:hypothetical protein|nr:hypothetical protein [Planctomycetaceae bacterium]
MFYLFCLFRISQEKNGEYTQTTLKFLKLNTQAQQHEAVVQGRSLPPIPASVYFLKMGFPVRLILCGVFTNLE